MTPGFWSWRESRVLAALMQLEHSEHPITIATVARVARLHIKDAEKAVRSLVARGLLDMGAVRSAEEAIPLAMPPRDAAVMRIAPEGTQSR
jgi:hypothetical protein